LAVHVQSLRRFIARCGDCLSYALIDFIFGIERQNFLPGNIDNHLAERNPAQLRFFID